MQKLFGTDGIRGVANEYPITPEMALKIGRAIARLSKRNGHQGRIVIGKDTRISGHMLEHALVSGICSEGVDAFLAGVLPTPGLAFITRHMHFDAGVMISASHNPFHDNGIKFFRGDGFKLSGKMEAELEGLILESSDTKASGKAEALGKADHITDACGCYVGFLKDSISKDQALEGYNIVLDCANGATFEVAPSAFTLLGALVVPLFVEPDGSNINLKCGSEHPETLVAEVMKTKADVGFAFDGDGDRVIAVDEKGGKLTGDQILAICAKVMKDEGRLANNVAVSTLMSNIGLSLALKELGIDHVVTEVGDKYVLQEMVSRGASIGGEDSGHMIFLDKHTTGDGIITALGVVGAMRNTGMSLSELAQFIKIYPQRLINVDIKNKPRVDTVPEIVAAIEHVKGALGEKGRVLVRYSGTQPVCRVMVEGPSYDETEKYCREIAEVVRRKLG